MCEIAVLQTEQENIFKAGEIHFPHKAYGLYRPDYQIYREPRVLQSQKLHGLFIAELQP
jgi:hypothetical protein